MEWRLLRAVSMCDFHAVSRTAKVFADFLGDHDGAVLAAGAAEGDRQVALALVNVVRQQEEQIGNSARDEFPRLGKRPNVLGNAGIAACQRPELGDEMRVWQEAYVGHHIGVLGEALPESEADTGHQNFSS